VADVVAAVPVRGAGRCRGGPTAANASAFDSLGSTVMD
jgi:hypothetical protein